MFSKLFLLAVVTCGLAVASGASSQLGWPVSSSGNVQTDWTGNWTGWVEAYPDTETGHGWNLTYEIGPYPAADYTCTVWSIKFTENGAPVGLKPYQFCRGNGSEDLYTDEGDGVHIAARWIDDVLVSPFKVAGVFALSMMRMRGDVLEEEIVITEDKTTPANETGVVSVRPNSIHRYSMRRAPLTPSIPSDSAPTSTRPSTPALTSDTLDPSSTAHPAPSPSSTSPPLSLSANADPSTTPSTPKPSMPPNDDKNTATSSLSHTLSQVCTSGAVVFFAQLFPHFFRY